jgi:hypothetical protein
MHMPQKHLQKDNMHNIWMMKFTKALINEPTLKTIRSFLDSTHFIIGNSIANVR